MSNLNNQEIIERACNLAEDITSTTMGKVLAEAIDNYEKTKDIESLYYTVNKIEGELSQSHFYDADILHEPINGEFDCA